MLDLLLLLRMTAPLLAPATISFRRLTVRHLWTMRNPAASPR